MLSFRIWPIVMLALPAAVSACGEDSSGDDANSSMVIGAPSGTTPTGSTSAQPTTPGQTPTQPTPTQTQPTPTTPAATTPMPTVAPGVGGAPSTPMDGSGGMGGAAADEPAAPAVALPADESEASMTAFITSEGYKGEGWVAETEAPRDQSMSVSPHGRVRVHQTQILLDSLEVGNGGIGSTSGVPHPTGSMAVKEMYDDADTLVGAAVLYKYNDESAGWAMWCYGPAERCATGVGETTADAPYYGLNPIDCGACHGGNIFTSPFAAE